MPIEYTRTDAHECRASITECPVCGETFKVGNGGRMFSTHLLQDHTEDDFGDLEAYKRDNSRHVLFDEPEIEEPIAGVSA